MVQRTPARPMATALLLAVLAPLCANPAVAQGPVQGIAGPAGGPRAAPTPPVNPATDPLLRGFQWRTLGPLTMGGRVDEIAVVESDPRVFYVGYATGGLWKTVNAGTTFEPIFDSYATSSIGSVAVSQSDPSVVWVGTGEANNRQSSSFGDGVYRSADAGATFTHMGLRETQSIHRLVIHSARSRRGLRRRRGTALRSQPGARCLQDERRGPHLGPCALRRRRHRRHGSRHGPVES